MMISIDGSFGEGGGQILRSSLALSLVTGQPFRVERIRAGRKKPGLMRQHLTAVKAAKEISNAEVTGDHIGSPELSFAPDGLQSGDYHWAVGTAGSTSLVLQTILPALLTAHGPSTVTLEGGTHNPFAPPFDFLAQTFLPIMNRMGPKVDATLVRPGFYPAGGGQFRVSIVPAELQCIDILERGDIRSQLARAIVAQLPDSICRRELKVVQKMLGWDDDCLHYEQVDNSRGPGNTISLIVQSDAVTEVFTGFGTKGLAAHKVPVAAVKDCRRYLASQVPVGRYLADQLMIPMAMAGSGRFRTLPLTLHAKTNIEVLNRFLDIEISATEIDNDVWDVLIERN
jgi:RNA 3'-terminal phosphate cyclase (ATP)